MAALRSDPHGRVPLRCRLGLHRLVELPKPENRMLRTFVVRSIRGCTRCGAVYTARFSNPLGGGGTRFSGYLQPAEVAAAASQPASGR